MKKKSKKTKAEKRMMKSRRSIILNVDGDAVADSFSAIVGTIWNKIQEAPQNLASDPDMLQALVELCMHGWNCAAICNNLPEMEAYVMDNFAGEYDESELEMIKLAAALKYQICPDERIGIQDAEGIFEDGEPAVSISIDWDAEEERASAMADKIPSMNEILDHDAIQKAVEGVPQGKVKDAMEAEVRRQIEEYNNTPRADLGGISPAEAYRRKHP